MTRRRFSIFLRKMQHLKAWKHNQTINSRIIIFYGMAFVHSISKTDNMKTCRDVAESFLEKLINLAANYNEVRLVFDRYLNTSLKDQTREREQRGSPCTTTSRTACVLPRQGQLVNPEYFVEGFPLVARPRQNLQSI